MTLTEQEIEKLEILIRALRLKLSQGNLYADAMRVVDYSTVDLLERINRELVPLSHCEAETLGGG